MLEEIRLFLRENGELVAGISIALLACILWAAVLWSFLTAFFEARARRKARQKPLPRTDDWTGPENDPR